MNCIFITIFNQEKYVDMSYLLLESIFIYGCLLDNTHILIYTSTPFMNKIKQSHLFNEQKVKFEINDTYNDIDTACKARLDIFKLASTSNYNKKLDSKYKVVWSNQWEPSTKTQYASSVYENRWGIDNHSNEDISTVDVKHIPDHDLLVGGFPCQDYSVATTLKNSKGLIGKKGVLWWSIHQILSEKKNKTKYRFSEISMGTRTQKSCFGT